jgi:golgin subfamily B member 1
MKMDETTNTSLESAEPSTGVESAASERGGAVSVDPNKVEALRARLSQVESRPNEYVKVLVELAQAVPDPEEKVGLYRRAAELYATRFGNPVEAVKAYEIVIQLDPADPQASLYLKEMYEKRRNYDALIGLLRREADALDGSQRTEAYRQLAELAMDKVKKPEICIPLWKAVLEGEPEDPVALDALAQLYERNRDYEALATALESLVQVTYDDKVRVLHLTKLGQIAGDRLRDDVRAAEAYRQLLVLDPTDKRAQEQLKKRYTTLGRWDDLEMLFAEGGNWDEFIRLLEANEGRTESIPQRISMLSKVAELWQTQKGKPDRAARALEKILSLDATNVDAAERLMPLYAETNNFKGLVGAIEVKLASLEPSEERKELLLRAAQLYEEKLRDKEKAFGHLLDAVSTAPKDESVLNSAERAAKALGAFDRLVQLMARAAAAHPEPEVSALLRLRMGRVLSEELGKDDDALTQYRLVYDEDPTNTSALSALERLYSKTERFDDLHDVYKKKLDLDLGPAERREVFLSLARLEKEQLSDTKAAVKTLEALLLEDEGDDRVLGELEGLYGEMGKAKDQAQLIERRIALAESDDKLVDLKFRLAGLFLGKLKRPGDALEQYREVLAIDVSHEGSREALLGMLEGDFAADAAAILETVFEQQEDWSSLGRVLEVRAKSTSSITEQVEILLKLSRLNAEQLGSLEGGIDALSRALRVDPSNQDTRLELEEFADRSGKVAGLPAIFEAIAREVGESDLAMSYWSRIAAIEERLGHVERAARAYDEILEIDPTNGDALLSEDRLFRQHGRFEELVKVYNKRIAIETDPAQSERLYAEMASVLETQLGQPEQAILAYQRVLSGHPNSRVALGALDRLLDQQQKWPELVDNLRSELELTDSEGETIRLSLRLAKIHEQNLNQPLEAIEGYRGVLERNPAESAALEALERLGQNPKFELVVSEILEPLYRASGDYLKLIAVHEAQLRQATDPASKVALLETIAEIHEDAGANSGGAFEAYARALSFDPARDVTTENLDRLASATGRFEELAAILTREAKNADNLEVRARLLFRSAELLEERVGDAERSIAAYQAALSVDPTSLPALSALERLFKFNGRAAELSQILQKKAGVLESLEEQKDALLEAAKLEADVLGRPEQAILVHERILELDPEALGSVDELINIYLAASEWPELLDAYARKVDLVSDATEKKQVLYEVGAVYEHELHDVPKAIDTYSRILELDSDDLMALGRLDALYQATKNWPELLGVLNHQAELTSDSAEATGYRYRIAALYEAELGDVERAIELYRDILGSQADHAETLAALERLKKSPEFAEQAAEVLEQVYEAAGDAARLVSTLEVRARAAKDPYKAVELLERIGNMQEDVLADVGAAFETYGRAVALDPSSEHLRETFERLALAAETPARAAEVYDQIVQSAKEPSIKSLVALRAAAIYESNLDDPEKAIARYRQALETEPESRAALTALDRLYENSGGWAELAEVLEQQAELGESEDEILSFKYRLGSVKEQRLSDVKGAVEVYADVLSTAPDHELTLRALETLFAAGIEQVRVGKVLEPLYQAAGEYEKLLSVREGQLAHLETPAQKLELLRVMAEDAESQLMDVERSFEILLRAVVLSPSDEGIADELHRLAPVVDSGFERLAGAYADVLESDRVALSDREVVGSRLARLFEEELSDVARAEQTYGYLLDIAPTNADALENLERIYAELAEWALLAATLEKRAPLLTHKSDQVASYLKLGHLYEEKLARGERSSGELDRKIAQANLELETQAEPISLGPPPSEESTVIAEPSLDELIPSSRPPLDIESVAPVSSESDETTGIEAAPEIRRESLKDATRAYRVVFDKLEPDNEDAIASLTRVYTALEEYRALEEVHRRELEHAASDSAEADAWAKLASLFAHKLGDAKGAIDGWKRVLDLRGEDPEALKELAYLYEGEQRWGELTDVLARHFDIAESDEDRIHVLTMRARLFDEQLGRDDEALENYQRVLDIDSSNVAALRAIANIWRRKKDVDELLRALHALTDYAGSELLPLERAEGYRELAHLYKANKDSAFDAADAYRKLLEVKPGDFEALDELEAYYRADEAWEEVIGVKMQRADALDDADQKVAELLQVAELWKSNVGRYDSARAAFEKILAVDPLHELAFKELEKLHTGSERWEPLIELYLGRLDQYEDAGLRNELLRRIARVFDERLDDKNQAFDALVTAYSEDYSNDLTATQLEKMAHATGRWNELLATANGWLQGETEKRPRTQLCLRLGKWYGEELGMSNYAQEYYKQVLLIDPHNVRVMRQMAAIERLAGNYQKVGTMLNKALDAAISNDDRKLILTDLGDVIYRNLDQAEQAIPYYRRALDVDGSHRPALDALERIYEDRGQIQDLIDILAKKAGAGERPEEVVRQKLRLGGLLEERMSDPTGAARAYRDALDVDAESLPALRGLERCLEALKEWPELLKVLERQLDVVATEGERVQVLLKLAEVQEQQFLKPDLAAARLEQAVQIDPSQEGAYVSLARSYRRLKKWPELISALERHLDETPDRATKIDLYLTMGAVYRDELQDLNRAIDSFQAVVDAEASHLPALEALSKLYERQGDGHRAVEYLTHVADLTSDGSQRVDLYYRIGRALEEKLSDRRGAREKFEQALDLDPGHLPSLAALRTIFVDEADWDSAAEYLEKEQARTDSPRQRARLLVELGRVREDMLSDHSGAIAAFEQAIQLDPECEDAGLALVREYVSLDRFGDAAPLAEMLVRRSRNLEKDEQHMLNHLLGQVMSKLGEHEKALKAYQQANQLDPTDQDSIRGIADAAFELSDWATALTNYQRVLTSLGEDAIDERADVYYRLGQIKRAQGQDRQAINNFEKALALNGEHRPTLDAMVAVYEKAGEFRLVAEYKRQILDYLYDGDARFNMLSEIGDLWADREKNPAKALEAYEEARDLKPENLGLLHKLLQNYQAAEEWQKMVDVLDAILVLEPRGPVKAKLLYTQAQISRDKLEDTLRAVELFNAALDLNPELLEAFERINKILTGERNWKQLERSYRKMLHRLSGKGKPELEHNLWHQLGLIYRDRTGQMNEAIEAFRMSASLVAEAPMQRQILAELYETNERWDDAIREQRRLVQGDPLNIDPYLALYRLALHKQSYDEAWCCASVISFLQKADEETERFFQDFRPPGMLPVTGRLGNDHWVHYLAQAGQSPHISKIFEMIVPAALQAKIAMLRSQKKLPQVDARFRQDPSTSTVTFAKTFGWAAQVLGIPTPPLYVRNDVPAYITALPTEPPCTVAGQLVLSGFQPQELTFICGKHLASYRADHFIKVLFPTKDELTVLLFAGVLLAAPQQPMPSDMEPQIRATAQSLAQYLQPVQLEGLKQVVKQFLADGARANVRRWSFGVEHTACRAGLVLCGDLEIARKIIGSEQQTPGDLTAADKMKDLLTFTVSEEYSALRKALGVSVQAG